MATTHYNFTTVNETDPINIPNAINTPLAQVDSALYNVEQQKANTSHASAQQTNGVGTSSLYGHLKISDSYASGSSDTALSTMGAVALEDGLNARIDKVEGRTFNSALLIGDSWGLGYYDGTAHESQNPLSIAAKALGVPDGSIYNACVGGAGYITGTTFLQQYNGSTHKDAELIIILGGQNDSNATADTASNAVETLITAIKSGSPNAEVHIFNTPLAYNGRLGYNITDNNPAGRMFMEGAVHDATYLVNNNITIHNGCYRWGDMFGADLSNSDSVHLNQAGYAALGAFMAQLIANRIGDYWPTFYGTVLDTQITGGTIQRNFVSEVNGMVNITMIWDLASAGNVITGAKVGTLPQFARRSFDVFDATAFQNPNGAFISIGSDISLQNISTNPGWFFLVKSYPAGY